jgi:hypothetical protein
MPTQPSARFCSPRPPCASLRLCAPPDATPEGDYHDLRIVDQNGVEIPYVIDPGFGKTRFPIVVARTQEADRFAADPGTQRYSVDLRAANAAIAAVRVDAATPAFARDVIVERSDDGRTWSAVTSGRITRFAYGPSHLDVATGEERGRWWRVTIRSGDDLPLAGVRVALLAHPHDLVFPVESGRRYVLGFSAPALGAPTYDLGERLRHDAWRSGPATLGPIVALAGPPDQVQADRGGRVPGWVTAAAFGAIIVALGGFALRLLEATSSRSRAGFASRTRQGRTGIRPLRGGEGEP